MMKKIGHKHQAYHLNSKINLLTIIIPLLAKILNKKLGIILKVREDLFFFLITMKIMILARWRLMKTNLFTDLQYRRKMQMKRTMKLGHVKHVQN